MWNIGGAILGGLLGGQSSTQSTTQSRDPYAPAQPFINQTINSGMGLQQQYQAQPLSLGQIGAYANSQGLTDGFRAQAADLTSQMNNMRQFDRSNPTQRATQFNFNSAPDTSAQSMQTTINSLPQASQLDLGRRIVEGGLLGNSQPSDSSRYTEEGGTPWGGIGTGNLTNSINGQAMDTFRSISPFSAVAGGLAALYQRYQAEQEALAAANAALDPIAHLNDVQGWTSSGGDAGSYFGGGYDGSGFAGLGHSGYGNTGYGDSDVSAESISEN
jgi:hypothetical protein